MDNKVNRGLLWAAPAKGFTQLLRSPILIPVPWLGILLRAAKLELQEIFASFYSLNLKFVEASY